MTTGSAVSRQQSYVKFDGPGAQAFLGGVSLLRDKQHCDNTLVVDHACPNGDSREQFRAVLDNQSHAVFQGKIVVKPHAQKTNSKMMTRALLLSDEAEADNKPELEIFADDVVCGHGATAGALDPNLKFYLMSRGIDDKQAEALLIQAFIGETVEEVVHEGFREALMTAALAWLETRG
jgi:Fe-S cluster assembly protein SufD